MADALCGPSNALQNFQKHTSVDRTLQQDRLVGRQSPAQGFRSSPGPNAGVDSEFDAFQQGRAGPPQDFQHFPQQLAAPPPQFAHAQQPPDWASDFQRLNIASQAPPTLQLRPQAGNAAAAWHQDFLRQQSPAAPAQQQNTYNGMQSYGMGGFAGPAYMQNSSFQPGAHMSQVAQGKQAAQEPAFDEAAFEQAFAQAHQDAFDSAEAEVAAEAKRAHARAVNPEVMGEFTRTSEDPLLLRIRETRPAVYSAIQVWSEMGLGRTGEAVAYLDNMGVLERSGDLVQDANEARWIVDSLQRIVDRGAPQEVKTRADGLIAAINQRIMSQYPIGARVPMSQEPIWQELDQAGYMKTPQNEMAEQEPKQHEEPKTNDDDAMAATAGLLLERVEDNTSEKFKNSEFLKLMRRLRDREVRVEGDKMVDVNSQLPASQMPTTLTGSGPVHAPAHPATQIPAIDPTILDHAATDFELPAYYETYETSPAISPITGERLKADAFPHNLVTRPSTRPGVEHFDNDTFALDDVYRRAVGERFIPAAQQDDDRWRHQLPGRDPVRRGSALLGYEG